MRLTKPSLQDLKKVSVMILCHGTESKKGSGTIVCVDDTLYVLTAAHVVSISENKRYDKEKISITAVKGDKIYTFKVEKIERYDYNQDCAVLKVSNENSFPEEPLKQVRILKTVPNGEGALCGFGNDEHEVKVYPFEQVGDTTWALHGFDVSLQPITAKENWGGFSGGGIFYKGENGELYLSCYMKGLTDIEGNNNGFVCYPAMRFTDVAALRKLLPDEEIVYVLDEGSMNEKKDVRYNQSFDNSINPQKLEVDKTQPYFLTSPPMIVNFSNVIGREKDLRVLWEVVKDKRHVMLTGFGGIGKTKLAQLLFHEYESEFDEVAWIDYQGGLRKSFLACINDPQFRESNYGDEKERWNAINSTLANDGKKKLIIIDNVDSDIDQDPEQDTELRDLTGWKDITILLTSRLDQLGGFENITLEALEKDNCIKLFNLYYQGKAPQIETVNDLVELANMHTFTIELLAKGAKREDLDEYYNKVKDGFEKVARTMTTSHHGGNATIEQHLKVLFDIQKRSELDKCIMNSFAILPVNCECTREEINQWFGIENADMDEVIQDGWLAYDQNKETYSIHPLVRTIIRFDFMEDKQKNKTIAPAGTFERMLYYFATHNELFDINNGFASLQRIISIVEPIIGMINHNVGLAHFYNTIGHGYQSLGDYNKALEFFEIALKVTKPKLSREDPCKAETYCSIAGVHENMGNYEKALLFYEKAMVIQESIFGKNHPITATTYNSIARVYRAKSNYKKALDYFKKAMKIRESKLGKNHIDTAMTYDALGGLYKDLGNYTKALEFYEEAMVIKESCLGKYHLDTATSYNNIAEGYRAKGENNNALVHGTLEDFENALKYHKKAMKIREAKLGEDHPGTAVTYDNIAQVYRALEDYENALKYHKKALIIREAKLGKNHPSTAKSYNNIGLVYFELKDYDKALEFYKKDMAISESKLGKNHPDTATTYGNMAGVYQEKHDWSNAILFYIKALRILLNKDIQHRYAILYYVFLVFCYENAIIKIPLDVWLKLQLTEKEWATLMKLLESMKAE